MLRNSNRSTFEIHSNVFRQIVVLLGWSHDMKIGQPKEMRRKEWMKAKEWENEWMREVRFEFLPKYQTNKRKQNRRCIIYTHTHTRSGWWWCWRRLCVFFIQFPGIAFSTIWKESARFAHIFNTIAIWEKLCCWCCCCCSFACSN